MEMVCKEPLPGHGWLSREKLKFKSSIRIRRSFLVFVCIALLAFRPGETLAAPPRETEVIIVGAGLSGLAAAYELKKAKVPFHILELGPRVGGRVRTVRYERAGRPEVDTDAGMEEYWESNP